MVKEIILQNISIKLLYALDNPPDGKSKGDFFILKFEGR